MPNFWQFPTVSMGLGPISAIYHARFLRYHATPRNCWTRRKSHVWCFVGDGEVDEPETLGAITLASREKLDNLIFVINCNLQRLDGPVRGNGKIIQELEAAFRGAGWNCIKVIWGSDWDPLLADDDDGLLVKRMGEIVDGQYQKYIVEGGALHSRALLRRIARVAAMVDHLSDEADCKNSIAAGTIRRKSLPLTMRRSTITAHRPSFWRRRSKAMDWARRAKAATSRTTEKDERGGTPRRSAPGSTFRSADEEVDKAPLLSPRRSTSPEMNYLHATPRGAGRISTGARSPTDERLEIPPLDEIRKNCWHGGKSRWPPRWRSAGSSAAC